MKKLITIFLAVAVVGCSVSSNIPRVVCSEKTVGVVIGDLVCRTVGFGCYAWQKSGEEVSPIELFYFENRKGRGW